MATCKCGSEIGVDGGGKVFCLDRHCKIQIDNANIRQFETGATRDTEDGKLDYEGFLSPRVVKRFAEYMHENRTQSDGQLRDSDNWQKGIPNKAYMKSGWRHFFDWWALHRGLPARECIEKALCGLLFNAMGYLDNILKQKEGGGDK